VLNRAAESPSLERNLLAPFWRAHDPRSLWHLEQGDSREKPPQVEAHSLGLGSRENLGQNEKNPCNEGREERSSGHSRRCHGCDA
jgi:hypothetical protein